MLRFALVVMQAVILVGLAEEKLLAHKFHFASAEVDWKTTSGAEITLKFHTEDLEKQMREAAGRDLEIDRDPAAKDLACAFAQKHFAIVPALEPCKCLGMEVGNHFTNIYLEAGWAGAKPLPRAVKFTAFQGVFLDQKNSVRLLRDGKAIGTFSIGRNGLAAVSPAKRRAR